jgi:hypothetical protein
MSMGHPSRARKSTWGADNASYDADSKIEGEDEDNTNDKGEERQNQDSGTWTISQLIHVVK